jgi:hypothetical protein
VKLPQRWKHEQLSVVGLDKDRFPLGPRTPPLLVELINRELVFEFMLGLVVGAIALWWVVAEMIEDWCRTRRVLERNR